MRCAKSILRAKSSSLHDHCHIALTPVRRAIYKFVLYGLAVPILAAWTISFFVLVVLGIIHFGLSDIPWLLAGLVGVFIAAVFVHEIGHALAGLITRMRFFSFTVGPFGFVRLGSGKAVGYVPQWWQNSYGSVCVLPMHLSGLRWRLILLLVAGPLANALLAGLLLWLLLHDHVWNFEGSNGRTAFWLLLMAWPNMLFSASSLIPTHERGKDSDGNSLLNLLDGGAPAKRIEIRYVLAGLLANGTRPRDLPTELVVQLLDLREGSMEDAFKNYLGYRCKLDAKQIEEAGKLLDLAGQQRTYLSSNFRQTVVLESAFFAARFRGNVNDAHNWMRLAARTKDINSLYLRAEAAVALADGKYQEALAKAGAAMELLHLAADRGGAMAESEWLNEIAVAGARGMAAANEITPDTGENRTK
jgi:hypothetical protein